MAVGTGYRFPMVANYAAVGNAVTYTNLMSLGRGVSMEWEVEASDTNNFYADDVIAESIGGLFQSGSGTAVVDGLDQATANKILGLPVARNVSVGGTTVSVQGYSVDQPPYVGIGFIRREQMNGAVTYRPIVFPKVRFSMPSGSAATQEEDIDWQTQELSFTIYRDDTTYAEWMITPENGMSSENDAKNFIRVMLGGTVSA